MRAIALVRRTLVAGGLLAAATTAVVAAPAGAQSLRVVARGLDSPRGLAFGPGGALYVTEAGYGGRAPCIAGPEGDQVCFGTNGAVTRIGARGRARRVLSGLPSLAAPNGTDAIGPSDISFTPRGVGWLTVGLGGNPATRAQLPAAGASTARLYRLAGRARPRSVADLGAFEAARNPDAGQPGAEADTNPNSVDATRGNPVVADAGGNDILSVTARGGISVLGLLPFQTIPAPDVPNFPVPPGTPFPVQPVPTSVVRGPDGALYVGQLTGFPFPKGAASVWRIAPGAPPTVYASGFTLITDLAFGRDRSLYVLQFASDTLAGPPTPGALIHVAPNGNRSDISGGRLQQATGLALNRRYAFVSHHSAEGKGKGQVVRIPLGR
jgi:hypothetical protein